MEFKMKIKKVAVGNYVEAYIEDRFSNGLNVISSDDNNKGKTILIQSMMYAFGNEPAFPTTFDYKNYYHYVEFEISDKTYQICRYNNGFVLKNSSVLMIFDSVSELKRYWKKHILPLPSIIKNEINRIVDPVLFLQLFFIGQDKKDSSNISHAGYYNKNDFYNMLFDMFNLSGLDLDEETIQRINEKLYNLKKERELLLKQYKILKEHDTPISYLSSVNDRTLFSKKISDMEKLNSKITELRKKRNKAATRRANWESTLKELRSLNLSIDCGELRCMDCDSTNISFSSSNKNAYSFDVSSSDMRKEIIESIKEKIDSYNEEMDMLSSQISSVQDQLHMLMDDEAISLESIVAYKEDIFSAIDAENRLNEIDSQIELLKNQLRVSKNTTQSKKDQQQALLVSILNEMNRIREIIDSDGNLFFDDLFTKKDEVYSGSEATVFHLSRLYAIRTVLNHDYPIIVDSFRAEDLSTYKENTVLELFKELPNQIVFTTTLKYEELGKYDNRNDINHIDFKDHSPSKMLSSNYLDEFIGLMTELSVKMH